jgi:phosphoglycolate phosphatase
MKLFFDLDGTLLDAKPRMYQLWQHLVSSSILSFDEYWLLKRDKISHERLLGERFGYSEEAIQVFKKEWMTHIEEPEWLSMDEPFEGVAGFLAECSKENQLYVVTARQFEDRALHQVGKYPWAGYITRVLVSDKVNGKYHLVRDLLRTGDQGWFIGDTGKDIETGKALGLKTAAVLSGFLSRERLLEYHPDQIINNVIELDYE